MIKYNRDSLRAFLQRHLDVLQIDPGCVVVTMRDATKIHDRTTNTKSA